MQWVTGFVPNVPNRQPQSTPRNPTESHPQQTGTLWNCGFRISDVRRYVSSYGTVTFVGQCFATDTELSRQARHAASQRDFMRWPGAYIVVIDDGTSLVVLSPISGLKRVYYVVTVEGVWWSTAAMPLAALIGADVDEAALTLDLCTKGLDPAAQGTTFFRGVRQLPPGEALIVREGKGHIKRWHSLSYHHDFSAAAVQLRESLWRSIESVCRQEGQLVTDLSGGKDSSTLASLAKVHKPGLVGVTFVTPTMKNDDLVYAEAVAKKMGIEHRIVQGGDETLHYADLGSVPLTDLPSNDAILSGYNRAKWQAVDDLSPRFYMTGTAGDCLLDAVSTQLCDTYRISPLAGLRGARDHARRLTASFVGMAFAVRRMSRMSYPQSIDALATALRRGESLGDPKLQGMMWCGQTQAVSWMTSTAQSEVAERVGELADFALDPVLVSNFQDLDAVQGIGGAREVCHALAAERGAAYYHPFFDTEVIDACLSLAGPARVGQPGFKPILGAAFGDVLPARLVDRRTKGNFNGMMYAGLSQNSAGLSSLIRDSVLVQRGMLDGARVAASLRRAINGLPAPLGDLQRFVVFELWMQKIQLRRTDWWEDSVE